MPYCDLHTHSDYSDGTYTPKQIIDEAEAMKLSAVALCDHNTVKGVYEFFEAALGKTVKAVAGIEISTDYGEHELHILGLFIPQERYEEIEQFVQTIVKNKEESNRVLIKMLRNAGYAISFDEIKAKTRNGQFNRANIACELTEKGYASSINDAFKTILNKFYIRTKRIPVFEAIDFLRSKNCTVVLAHPFLNLNEAELRKFLPQAKASGLDAMEVFYPTYDAELMEKSKAIADEFGLLYSGGSDFHGTNKIDIKLGHGRNNVFVQDEIYKKLFDARG